MPSTLTKLPNTIHIRDFVLNVGPDKTKSDSTTSCYIEIQADVNVFADDEVHDSTIIVEPIHTCIRVYIKDPHIRALYVPEAFFYAYGRFHTALTKENKMEIIVQVFSLERYDCSAIAVSTG
jgi:hypothetical protein